MIKLFHFCPDAYGEEAFVAAISKESAIEFLKRTTPQGNTPFYVEYHKEKINKMINCLEGYTIEEHNMGEVVFGEVC